MAGKRPLLFTFIAVVAVVLGGLSIGRCQDQPSPPPTPQTTAPQQEGSPPEHISSGVAAGLLVRKVRPDYPNKARKKHIQGTVILRARIGKEGNIADLALVSGDPLLAKAAIAAVKQWKYRPYFFQG